VKRNISLYSLKAIACFFVVCLHINFPDKFGTFVVNVARFAIPAFFMISGYFSYRENREDMSLLMKKRIKKIFLLTIFVFACYLLLNIFAHVRNNTMTLYVSNILNYKNAIKFIFLNWTTPYVGVGHLWYLFSLIYVYIVMAVINRFNLYKIGYVYTFCALVFTYALEIYNSINDLNISQIYYRNAWLIGISFFMLGILIKRFEKYFILSNSKFYVFSIILTIFVIFMFIIEQRFMNNDNCVFLNGVLLDILFFVVALNRPNINFFSSLGRHDSSNIYLVHYAVLIIINMFFIGKMGNFSLTHLPIIVFMISYLISIIYRKIIKALINQVSYIIKKKSTVGSC
jgi:surface polysaccharide O-acyltransferase-like enzyme